VKCWNQAFWDDVNEWWQIEDDNCDFPSLKRRGGCAINKMDPFRNGAAGVVSSAGRFRPETLLPD